jgi:hypothetical protein
LNRGWRFCRATLGSLSHFSESQILLDRENQRLITKTLQLTAELARLRGVPDPEQLALAELRALEQRRAEVLTPARTPSSPPPRPAQPGHGPRSDLDMGHGAGRLAAQRFRQSGALHAGTLDRPDAVAYLGSSEIGYSPRVRGLRGAGSRSVLPLRFSVIFEYGGLIP